MIYLLWLVPALTGLLSVYYAQWRRGRMGLKLAVTSSVLVLVVLYGCAVGIRDNRVLYMAGIALALAASMVGDYFLSRGDETFVAGIFGFLIAHGGYLTAFLSLGGFNAAALTAAFMALLVFLIFVLKPKIDDTLLFVAVSAYTVISALVIGASFGTGSGFLIAGALLIAFSDIVIAVNKFVRPIGPDELIILSTYYGAQILIGMGSWGLLI